MRTLRIFALLLVVGGCGDDDGDGGLNLFGEDGDAAGDGDDCWFDSDGDSASSGDGQSDEERPEPVVGPELAPPGERSPLGALKPPCELPTSSADRCTDQGAEEPNDKEAPLSVSFSDGCYALSSTLSPADDADAVRWTNPRHDPVHVGVAYTSTADVTNDLNFEVSDATDSQQALRQARRSTLSEHEQAIFLAQAGGIYTLEAYVFGDADSCQPYALYVDTRWCSDELEDNDAQTSATELEERRGYTITANISHGDDDYYRYTAPRTDPVLIQLEYTAQDGDDIDVDLALYNRQGEQILRDEDTRSQAGESFGYWSQPAEAGNVYAVQVYAWNDGCAPYELIVDVDACTDPDEDNDTPDAATPLTLDQAVSARLLDTDPDYYDISRLSGPLECVLSFDQESGNETIALRALDVDGTSLASDETLGSSDTQTAYLRLAEGLAHTLEVEATEDDGRCLLYHLRCVAQE